MHQSKVEVFVHYVWATHQRLPMISPHVERAIHRCIQSQVRKLGCDVIALEGTDDHIHLLVRMAATVDAARLMNQVKGASSYLITQEYEEYSGFAWQDGYAAFSVTPGHVSRVAGYVRLQKQHHETGALFGAWEPSQPRP